MYVMSEEIRPALTVKVSSLSDLVRLAATLASRMIVMPIYRKMTNDGAIYFLQMMYKDYYKFYGVPVIYYYKWAGDKRPPEKSKYILAKSDEGGEKIEISDRTRTGWLVVPIINVEELPPFIELEEPQS